MQQVMQYMTQASTGRRGSGSLDTGGMTDFETTKHPTLEGILKYWGNKEDNPIQCDLPVMCVRFSPDGSLFAVGLSDGAIRVYSTESMQYRHSLIDDDTTSRHLPVTSIRFLSGDETQAENRLMATYASGYVKFWHYTSRTSLAKIDEERQTLSCAWNPMGSGFITCGADPQIIKYDAETKQQIRVMEPSDSRDVMNGHRARVFAIQYHPHYQNVFVSGGWDDTVQFWDDREGRSKRKVSGPHICGDALDIDATHNHILTGSWRKENTLQIWDFNTGEKIKDVPQDNIHGSRLYCAQWLGKDHIMCGGCEQNTAKIIDRGTLNTVGQLMDLPHGVYCMDHHGGRAPRILVSSGSRVHVLKLEKRQ